MFRASSFQPEPRQPATFGWHLLPVGRAVAAADRPCRGQLNTKDGSFTPEAVCSFRQLVSRDTLIVRTFDLTGSAHDVSPALLAPLFLRMSCRTPTGASTPDPWKASGSPAFQVAAPEASLCFATAASDTFPCYRQVDPNAEGRKPAPVTYLAIDVDQPTTYLMRVLLATAVVENQVYENPYFGADPEMIVGPYAAGG